MRTSGVLLPIFSLPSAYGIGGFSKEARAFVDRLAKGKQRYWQILPLGPMGQGNSPYQPISCFAGEITYIDPETLQEKGLVQLEDLEDIIQEKGDRCRISYDRVVPAHKALLRKAARTFRKKYGEEPSFREVEGAAFLTFCRENEDWLEDFALYMSLRDVHCDADWMDWEEPLKMREEEALKQAEEALEMDLFFWRWSQYEFFCEWDALRTYAHRQGVEIIGDIPIYAAYESADCWAHPELFQLNENRQPVNVSGAPPDAFTPLGQCWGNPLYDWDYHKETDYGWWMKRLSQNFRMYDVVRLDHMRGFESYYSIPADTRDALTGHWEKGPDMDFFQQVKTELPQARFIAEDLGFLTEEVFHMIGQTGYPGMKILQFAFDSDESNLYLPNRYDTDNSVVYTGTHDNDTTLGWYRTVVDYKQRFATWYLQQNLKEVIAFTENHPEGESVPISNVDALEPEAALNGLIQLALSTRCETCIIPMQDWLGLDTEARINLPGTPEGNWGWQMEENAFSEQLAEQMAVLTEKYDRC